MRFTEDGPKEKEARQLIKALEKHGVKCFLSAVTTGKFIIEPVKLASSLHLPQCLCCHRLYARMLARVRRTRPVPTCP